MKNIFNLIDKHPTLSLQAIGFLTLLNEPDAKFHFSTRESFLMYFRFKTQTIAEQCLSELIGFGIVQRSIIDDKQKYCISKKIEFEVPLELSKNKTKTYFNEQIQFIHKGFYGKVRLLFKECEKYLELQKDYMRIEDIQKFFAMFDKMVPAQYIDFFKAVEKTKIYSLKYLDKIADTVKSKKPVQTYSENLSWDKEKEENSFAIKVATGEALTRKKYHNLIEQNKFDILKAYYDKGKKLLHSKDKLYTQYDWL